MVAPFKPTVKTIVVKAIHPLGGTYVKYRLDRTGINQMAPFVDTNFRLSIYETLKGNIACDGWAVDPENEASVFANNAARAKFVSSLGDSSSFGASLTAERKSTWNTVVDTITRTGLAAHAVSRGKFGRAAKYLGIEPPTKKQILQFGKVSRKSKRRKSLSVDRYTSIGVKDGSQSVGNKWLWYSYGVKPLMQDIYNGMDVLQRPLPWKKFYGFGTATNTAKYTYDSYTWISSVKCSALVSVKNPNLWLANQMGLVNPVQWINEGIPFSFVVDWFSNLSQIISQLTDFVGLDIAKPITTEKCSVTNVKIPPADVGTIRYTRITRKLTVPTAKLKFAYERFSWQRGANAVSLLLQFLPKKS